MTWKERFGHFLWKTHCFPDLKRISGQCDDFKNFDAQKCAQFFCFEEMRMTWKAHSFSALKRSWGQFHEFEKFGAQKCDLAKTCCAWPEKSVLYNFHGKRTVFQFWRKFEASFRILRTLALKNQIWPKRATHNLKSGICSIFLESALFFCFEEMRMTWKERLVQFSWKAHCFSALKRIWGQFHDFENLTLKNAIWPKRTAHDLKRALCTIFMESALFSSFGENLRPVSRFRKLWFGQKVLRMTWKERFVQFSLKVLCFPALTRISGQGDDFENFDAQKCDLAKKCSAWHEKSVLYNFHGRRTVFSFWREFQARVTILRISTLRNAISPKRAQHYLKRAFCTIFMESALFSRFGENFRPVWRFWEIDAQNVLRMTWKERFVQVSWKAYCFHVLL